MEIPVQSQVGDIGYVTATSPVFQPMFNIIDRDSTARHIFYLKMNYSLNGFERDNISAPIFEGIDQNMVCIGDRRFKSTIQFSPPTNGTTRRLLSFEYDCYISCQPLNDASSFWTGSEPTGIELHLMEVFAATCIDTYWLDCSVDSSQYSAPLTNGGFQEMRHQDLKFDLIAEFDSVTSRRQVQLVGVTDTKWSEKYNTSLTLLETRGPRYAMAPLRAGQDLNAKGRYGIYLNHH
ncbi:hypothetical protein FA95DRAFT_508006 [Auriscalpium vulgare]|uniref:Uncharacterized protein n=1 Tax=Auriscalpium vulgare TaxID=40419 RepID=A0ACB8RG95_9AGAM|nr:hypothetical protein FA95DRAFT_508006 [Auriscalpium vulgare]